MRKQLVGAAVALIVLAACGNDDTATVDGGSERSDASTPADAGEGSDAGGTTDASASGDAGAPVSAMIGAEGGSVTSADGFFELVIPSGALGTDTTISIHVLPATEWPTDTITATPLAAVYEVLPEGLEFAVPATAIHRFTTRPTALEDDADFFPSAVHVSRTVDGTIELLDTRTIYSDEGSVRVEAELEHLSRHWATHGSDSDGRNRFYLPMTPSPRRVGESWTVDAAELHVRGPRIIRGAFGGSDTSGPAIAMPLQHEGWRASTNATRAQAQGFHGDGEATPTAPFAYDPRPGWRCLTAGTTRGSVFLSARVSGGHGIAVYREGPIECVAPTATRIPVGTNPEAAQVLPDGRIVSVSSPPAGPATHTAITTTGTRLSNPGQESAHDFVAYENPFSAGELTIFTAGPVRPINMGLTATGWTGTGLERLGNDTSIRSFPRGSLTPTRIALFEFSRTSVRIMDTSRTTIGSVLADQFTGGVYPAAPVSGDFGPDGARLLVVLNDGDVYYGPWSPSGSPSAGPMMPVGGGGDPSDEPRFVRCFENSSDLHVCALAMYGSDEIHVFEVTATEARAVGEIAVGDGPIDPAVIAESADSVLIAAGGALDDSLTLLRYAPSTEVLIQVGTRVTLPDCDEPNHASFASTNDLVVSCFGSSRLLRLDPLAFVGG